MDAPHRVFPLRVNSEAEGDVEDVIARHAPMISRRVRRVPEGDRADLAQEVLMAALRQVRGGRFRADADIGTWLWAIADHKVADYWRRQGRRAALDIVLRPDTDTDTDTGGRWTPQEVAVLEGEVIAGLDPRDVAILHRSVLEGWAVPMIGAAFGLSDRQVWTILKNTRARFEEAFLDRPTDRPI